MSKSLIERILDPNDNDPITLYTETGEAMDFEQIALIPMNGAIYLLARPMGPVEGMGPDEALVFALGQDEDGDWCLEVEDNDAIVDAVFGEYYRLLREAGVDTEEE